MWSIPHSKSDLQEHFNSHYPEDGRRTYVMQLLGTELCDCNKATCWLWRTSTCRNSCFSRACKASVSLANVPRSLAWTSDKDKENNTFCTLTCLESMQFAVISGQKQRSWSTVILGNLMVSLLMKKYPVICKDKRSRSSHDMPTQAQRGDRGVTPTHS